MTDLEVRGMTVAAIKALLVSALGGAPADEGTVAGDGWRVTVTDLPRAPVGRFGVRACRLTVAADPAMTGVIRRLFMRGGG